MCRLSRYDGRRRYDDRDMAAGRCRRSDRRLGYSFSAGRRRRRQGRERHRCAAGAALSNAQGAGKPAVIFVADGATAVATCRAILMLDNQKKRVATGPVTLNAMAGMASDATLCDAVAALPDLASLWAVDPHLPVIRRQTLAYHRRLQASARNTHFLVLWAGADFARELSSARSTLGREARWLLDPVNSLS